MNYRFHWNSLFQTTENYYNYLLQLPSFYQSLITQPRPYGLFLCSTPNTYPTVATFVYNFSKEEVYNQDLSRLKDTLLRLDREGERIDYFQEIHLICTDIQQFFVQEHPKVKCLIIDIFDNPEFLYYIQAIPFLSLVRTHFDAKTFEVLATYMPFGLKRLKQFGNEKGDNRVYALAKVYEHFHV